MIFLFPFPFSISKNSKFLEIHKYRIYPHVLKRYKNHFLIVEEHEYLLYMQEQYYSSTTFCHPK